MDLGVQLSHILIHLYGAGGPGNDQNEGNISTSPEPFDVCDLHLVSGVH